jgi:hypothetical protein
MQVIYTTLSESMHPSPSTGNPKGTHHTMERSRSARPCSLSQTSAIFGARQPMEPSTNSSSVEVSASMWDMFACLLIDKTVHSRKQRDPCNSGGAQTAPSQSIGESTQTKRSHSMEPDLT